ncbi:cytochrome P450 [Streptomyces sp. AM 2-1-1]|uniref:cytochrome P450 n=1 Tax=Streptomyces sp. AM 2-1-1 TaxID=3028709 RepID=UPI0023B8CEEC|nr:cytochrome P450 [Streptomyces sp. AM 2-1-1]WEH41418.1 cytochrome P450 [Streptomyces sp. AM 2-1-1]
MTTSTTAPTTVEGIPHVDPQPTFVPMAERSAGGIPQITLPSGHTALHVTRYVDVHRVLTGPQFGRTVTNVEDGPSFLPTIMPKELLLNLDAPDHARMRGFVNADYSAAGVDKLRPVVRELLAGKIARLRAEESPDLFRTVLDTLPAEVNGRFLGIPDEDIAYYRPLGHTVQVASHEDVPGLVADFTELYTYLAGLVSGARPRAEGGLIDRFVAARGSVEPPLDDAELIGILLGSVLGADQNILSVASKILYVLLCRPALWQRLAQEPEVADRLVDELIRLIPLGNISAFPRVASERVEISGGFIEEGDVVYPDAFRANRDPEVFADPLTVDVDRTGRRHLQFGYGMHHCMGAALARMEIAELLTALAAEFPTLTLDADPATLPWDSGVILRRPTALPVRW